MRVHSGIYAINCFTRVHLGSSEHYLWLSSEVPENVITRPVKLDLPLATLCSVHVTKDAPRSGFLIRTAKHVISKGNYLLVSSASLKNARVADLLTAELTTAAVFPEFNVYTLGKQATLFTVPLDNISKRLEA